MSSCLFIEGFVSEFVSKCGKTNRVLLMSLIRVRLT